MCIAVANAAEWELFTIGLLAWACILGTVYGAIRLCQMIGRRALSRWGPQQSMHLKEDG